MTTKELTQIEKLAEQKGLTVHRNVTFYTVGGFGVQRTDCKELTIETGVKYAQYNDAVAVVYLEKGKRKVMQHTLAESRPYLLVVETKHALEPDSGMVSNGAGSSSRYSCFDIRYLTDWVEKSKDLPRIFEVNKN